VDLSGSGRLMARCIEYGDELSISKILNYLIRSKMGARFLFNMNSMSTLWGKWQGPKFRSWKETLELWFSIYLDRALGGRWSISESIYRYAVYYRLFLFQYFSLTFK
jgi:hypothetical protein